MQYFLKRDLKIIVFQNSSNEVAQIVPSSSDEELDISINTDDEEESDEQIIERRRKQREQLLKACIH